MGLSLACVLGGASSRAETVTTGYAGGSPQQGIMFDVMAAYEIDISHISVNLQVSGTTCQIYYRQGSHAGHTASDGGWELIATRTVTGTPGQASDPIELELPPTLPAGRTASFYITSTTPGVSLNCSNDSGGGSVQTSDGFITIYKGTGLQYPFTNGTGTTSPSKLANATLHYSYRPAYFWKGQSSNVWSGTNWASDTSGTAASGVPGIEHPVIFSANGAANRNVTLNAATTIRNLVMKDSVPVTIGGTGKLNFSNESSDDVITVTGGSVMTISAPVAASTAAQGTRFTVAAGSELVISGSIQPFYMTKDGGGLMRLTGTLTSNDYNLTVDGGAFTVDGGTANFGNAGVAVGSAGDGTLNIINGGTISSRDVDVGVGAGGNVSVIGASSVWNQNFCSVGRITPGAFSVSGGATINSSRVYVGSISSGSIQVTGVGSTWNASAGVLVAFDVGGTGTVTVENGALISTNQIELGNNGGTATLQLNGSASPGRGVIRAGAIVRQGGTSTLNFNGGKLEATGSESNYLQNLPSGAITLQGGGFYMDTKAFNVGIQSVMGGSGPLVKQGSGTLTLTASNSFTGETTIEAGTLVLPAASSLASTAVRITGGGTLSGEGTLSGNCFLTTGSLQPGTAGMQAGGLRWATTGGLTAKLGTTATPLRLTGTAIRDGSGPLTLTLEDAGYVLNQTYTLMTFSSTTLTAADIVVEGGIPGTLQVLATSIRFTPLTPTLQIDDQSVDEGNSGSTTMTFHVTLSIPAPAGGVTFDYATQADTAASPSDFTAASGSVTIPAGSSSATIVVTINGDTVVEGNEAFSMNLSNVSGATVLDGSGRGTIRNDDTATVTMSPVSVSESNVSTTNMIFTASLDNAVQGGFTVNYATADGTATTADGDYTATSGTLAFTGSAGQTRTIVVVSNGDTKVEANETFTVSLGTITGSAPAGAITASGNTGTITNNDSVTISLSPVTQNEGSGGGTTNFTFTATASNAVQGGFSVAYSTADGTAIAGSDYTSSSGTLAFSGMASETQTIVVPVAADSTSEPDETFTLSLGAISGTGLSSILFTTSGSPATGTILNDDVQQPVVVSTTLSNSSLSNTTYGGGEYLATPGEIITYQVSVTVPDGTTPDLRIRQELSAGIAYVPGGLNLVTTGFNGTVSAPAVSPTSGVTYGEGQDVLIDFASISCNADANPSNNTFTLTFQAVVLDVPSVKGIGLPQTYFTVSGAHNNGGADPAFGFTAGSVVLGAAEPRLNIDRSVSGSPADAGDTVTYTIRVLNQGGRQNAYDVALAETFPSGLSPVAGSLSATLGSSSVTPSFSLSGQTLSTVTPLDVLDNQILTLTYQAVLTSPVTPNQTLTSTANLTYSSYPGDRTATGGFNPNPDVTTDHERGYTGSGDATVQVQAGSATWALASTNQPHTSGSSVTIGEQATYRATVTLPEGTTPGLSLAAILPPGMQYVPGSATVDTSGFNGTVPGPSVSGGGGNGDDVTITFGSISVTGDNVSANNSFSLLISARVMDVPLNSNGTMLSTQLGFDITGDNIAQATSPSVDLTILQPAPATTLSIAESNASPGGQVTFTLTLSNSAAALTGYGPAIQVLLPTTGFDSSTISFGTEGTDFPVGFHPTTTGNMINYTSTSGTSLAGGDTVSFTFRVNVLSTLSSGSVVTANAATGSLSTLPGIVSGERTFSPVSGTDSISITNSAPTAITLTGGSIAENNLPGATVGTLSATDNAGDTATFAFISGAGSTDNGSFTITGNTLTINSKADFETKPSYSVRIQVTDSASQTYSQALPITISDANDTPVATAQSLLSVDEDGSLPVTLSGTDQDNDTLTYSISTGPSHGSLSGTAPNFTYTPAADYNGTDSFQFTASDASATSLPATVSITVNAVNDAPTLAAITSPTAIDEDAAQQTIVLSGIAAGGGETQTLTITAVSDNPSLIPNPAVTYTSPAATGSLAYTPVANASGTAIITVTVNDGQATNNTVSRTFTVTVNAVNDAPALAAITSPVAIDEDAAQQTIALSGISAGPGETQTLTITAVSDNPSLIPNPAVTYTSPATTGSLSYTPVADASGTAIITVTVNDGQATNNTVSRTFTVTVNPVNDAPALAAITSPAAIDEDAAQQTIGLSGISPGPGETQTLTITAVSDNPSLIPNPSVTYTNPSTAGSLSYTPVANASGTAIITVTVDDGQATNNLTTRTFTVTVNAVNDAPALAAITSPAAIDEDAAQQTIALSGLSPGPGETQTLTITAVSDNPSLIPNPAVTYTNPSATGSLAYTPVANASGTAIITVTVNDGQATNNTVSRTFTVTVNPVNDVPSFTKGADQTEIFGTNTARTVTGWATNISDGDPQVTQALVFNVTVSSGGGIFTTAPAISGNGTLTYKPNGTAGTATISVTLTDDATAGGAALTSLAQTFTIATAPQADYLVTTSAGVMTVKDNSGNSDTLAVTQSTTGTIRFASTGRNFSINGGANISGNSGDLPLAGITSILIQAQGGNDVVSLGTVAGMPSLGVTGGDGADTVNVAGVLTFLADASLTTESEALLTTAGASVITSGSGTIRFNVDDISLDPASSIASARYVRINQFTSTRLISLGLEQTGKLSLTDAELDTITSPAAQIGQGLYPEAAYASIAVTASISPAGINTLLLYCREAITCSPGASVTVPKLGLQSSNENVGTEAQPLLTQVGTIEISATGGIIVSNTGPVTIGGIGFILTEPKPIGMLVGYQNPIKVASTGTMTVSGYLFGGSGGPITLSATGAGSDVVIQSGKPPTISGVTGGQVSISAGRDILVGTAVARGDTEGSSGLALTAGRDVIVDAGSIIRGGGSGVNVTAGKNLAMPGNIAAGAGISSFSPISITANLVTIGQSGTSAAIGSPLGTLNLTTDALEITSPGTHAVLTPGSILAIKPRTAGRPITLGGAPEAGSLQILQSVLDRISGGSFLTIGDPASGTVTLKSAINRTADSIDIKTGSSVDFSGGSLQTTATILTFNCPAGTFRPWSAGEDAGTTQSSGIITPNGKVSLRLNGTAPDTGYDQFRIRGKVSLGLFPLELTGSHVPLIGQSFTLIDNDGTDAVDGTFSGLPQGATLTFNGVLMRINYAGGDGNDVVLALANFAPTDIALSPSSIDENNAPGATVGTLTATDPDVTDTHTFSLVTGTGDTNNSSFTVSGNQLKLSLAADYETKASYSVRVRADDGRGGTYDKALTVIINNINDAPVISSIAGRFTDEDTPTAAIPFTISDQDAGAVLTLSVESSDPSVVAVSSITLGGTGANRTVTVTPVENASGMSYITIKVSDGTLESGSTFFVAVSAVNDQPVLVSALPDVLQTKPGLTATINLESYFSDIETAASALTYAVSPAPGTPFYSIARVGNTLQITGTAPGVVDITVTATDSDTASVSDTFQYKVKAIPQVVDAGIPDTTLPPDSTGLDINLASYFSDADGDAITYGILTNTEPGKVSATITGSTLTLDPLADGSSILVISATDSDGNTTSDSFVVTVPKPVPTLTPTVGFTPHLNRQTGLYEIAVTATNGNRFDVPGFRLRVTSVLPAGIRLWNSTAPAGSNEPYLDVLTRTAPGESVTVILEFHSATRNFDGFNPTIIAEPLPDTVSDTGTGAGIAVTLFRVLPDGSTLLEFTSEPGAFYQIEYSSDLANWKKSLVPIQAGANRVQWIDRGAPYTDSHPSTVGSRYYRVSRINNN